MRRTLRGAHSTYRGEACRHAPDAQGLLDWGRGLDEARSWILLLTFNVYECLDLCSPTWASCHSCSEFLPVLGSTVSSLACMSESVRFAVTL